MSSHKMTPVPLAPLGLLNHQPSGYREAVDQGSEREQGNRPSLDELIPEAMGLSVARFHGTLDPDEAIDVI